MLRNMFGMIACLIANQNLFCNTTGRYTSKEAGLVIYLAFLARMANLYYMILAAFKKFWQDTVAKFISGIQDRFI